jgi:cytochrome c5
MALISINALANDGKAVYEKSCVACHASGVANAPKLGDKAAWAPRVGAGRDALVATVIKGKGAMPPKAGSADLKEAEIKAAVDFMLASVK